MVHFLNAKETIPLLCLLLCVSAVNLPKPIHDDPPYGLCSNNITYSPNSTFQKNLNSTMLSLDASASKIYNTSTGSDFPDRVYGQYMCINYVSDKACNICISKAVDDIKNLCPNDKEAVVWEEDCQLRYSYKNFLGLLDVSGDNDQQNPNNITDPENFRSVVNKILTEISKKAAFDPSANMYATGKAPFRDGENVYALVQCTPDLSPDDCNTCLLVSMANASSCCYFSRGARVLKPSCYLRYELYAFYEGAKESFPSEQDQEKGKSGHSNLPWIFASPLLVVIAIAFLYCYLTGRKVVKECKGRNEMTSQQVQLENTGDRNNSNFQHHGLYPQESAIIDLASIQAATDKFSDLNLLGEGGFGPVYKGVLNDGKEIAVKRLSSFSEQGVGEFMNEVLLIMKLQHKNLVRLLGVCVDGGEKLLVYEFLPNGSLDVVLSDPEKRSSLTWRKRMAIINGIAKGLLYLQEDSRLRIIHRDLKPSNILLDSNMKPKISDFGMARIFESSEGEASTARIAGTYGYMAPEYAMEGLYSFKSDVFSFGVLLLEILTGKKNAGFHTTKIAPSLLAYAWQLWNEGNEVVLMDHLLADSCCPDEFSRYIHVGLLCVQEDAFDRPTMPIIVSMLKSETVGLPQPNRPAFSVGRFTDHDEAIVETRSMNGLTISNLSPR